MKLKSNRNRSLVNVLFLSVVYLPGVAQTEVEIFNKALQASLSLHSYEADVYDSTGYSGVATYKIRQQVSDSADIGFGKCTFWISGSNREKQQPLGLSYDGTHLRILDPADKAVLLFEKPSPKVFGAYMGRLNYPPSNGILFFSQQTLADKWVREVQSIERINDIKIYDEECFSLSITRKITTPDKQEMIYRITLFISKSDYLIRGYRREQGITRIKILQKNQHYNFSLFTVDLPVDFKEKQVANYISPNVGGLLSVNSSAPDFMLKTANNKDVSLSSYRGKVVLLDFWGTWCGPCRKAMPHLQLLHEKYKSKGLEVIGISVADADGNPEKFMKAQKYTYGLLVKGESVARKYQVDMFPTVYLIDQSGTIIHAEKGIREVFEKEISVKIEELLQK